MTWPSQMTPATRQSGIATLVSAVLLFGPAVLLGLSAARADGLAKAVSAGVAVTLGLEALFLMVRYGARRTAGSLFVLVFFGITAAVLRFNAPDFSSPSTHLNLAVSILIPVGLFGQRELATTGGPGRQLKFLVRQLLARKEWP